MVRDLACPQKTAELRASAGVSCFGMAQPPSDAVLPVVSAVVENPFRRLRAVWLMRLHCPSFRAEHPMRLCSLKDFGAFFRWVIVQDPLAVDTLVRPQWAMIPDGASLTFVDYPDILDETPTICKLLQTMYQDDFDLWAMRNISYQSGRP